MAGTILGKQPKINLTSALGRVRYRIGNEIAFHSVTMAKGRTNF